MVWLDINKLIHSISRRELEENKLLNENFSVRHLHACDIKFYVLFACPIKYTEASKVEVVLLIVFKIAGASIDDTDFSI